MKKHEPAYDSCYKDFCWLLLRPGPMGGIIAVSYEARRKGVTRQMSGQEAKKAGGGGDWSMESIGLGYFRLF